MDTLAWSVNGRDVSFRTSFDFPTEIGGYVVVRTPHDARLLTQVHFRHATESSDSDRRMITGGGNVIRRLDTDETVGSFDNGTLVAATAADVASIALPSSNESVALEVGRLTKPAVPAGFRAAGFSRHTFLCGQSGSGKTYSMGVLLERVLMDTTLPMIIVDPNSDHVHLGVRRDGGRMNGGPVIVAGNNPGANVALRVHLSDLLVAEQALTISLDPIRDAAEYGAFVEAISAIGTDRYGMRDIARVVASQNNDVNHRLAQRITNLGVADWSIWANEGESSLVDVGADWRVLILDVGSLHNDAERAIVSLALLGFMRRRAQKRSVLIVIDEAHNVCPPRSSSVLGERVTDYAVWIAGEGRKFGLHLLLATQRPQKVHPNVLSQCDNLLLMRMNSRDDLRELGHVFSHVPEGMINESTSFTQGEMLASGPIVRSPLRLQMGARLTPEGGADLPTDWARPQ
jgi:DNA helicase HerA-like ATPase